MTYSDFEERLESLIQKLSTEDRTTLMVRLLVFLKLNVIDYYLNCKNCIGDPRGRNLMDHLTSGQKKYLDTLEQMAPYLPEELENDYVEMSRLMVPLETVDIPGISVMARRPVEPAEGDVLLELSNEPEVEDAEPTEPLEDEEYLLGSIEQKGWELKMIQKLSGCIHDNTCGEVFSKIIEEERQNMELLVSNYNYLRNNGKWPEP